MIEESVPQEDWTVVDMHAAGATVVLGDAEPPNTRPQSSGTRRLSPLACGSQRRSQERMGGKEGGREIFKTPLSIAYISCLCFSPTVLSGIHASQAPRPPRSPGLSSEGRHSPPGARVQPFVSRSAVGTAHAPSF